MTNEDAHDHTYEVIQDFVLALRAWKKDRKQLEAVHGDGALPSDHMDGLGCDMRYSNAAVLASVLALMNLAVETELRAFPANDPTGIKTFNAILSEITGSR